jgi:arginase
MIAVPYHLGRRDVEVGRGPTKILEALNRPCHIVERINSSTAEVDAVADVNAQLAGAVARHEGPPVILAGNCNSCVGTLAGFSLRGIRPDIGADIGVVWFDAHGDFNTPETTISGALEGMSLAIATGGCHEDLRRRIGLSRPVPEANCILVATRSLDAEELVRLRRSGISMVGPNGLAGALERLATRVAAVYVHLDLDVLDPAQSPGVNFQAPGGISPEELYRAVALTSKKVPIAAAAIANFNPDRDREDRTLTVAQRLVDILP